MEVDQDLSAYQEGKLLSWMVEFLLWLKVDTRVISQANESSQLRGV